MCGVEWRENLVCSVQVIRRLSFAEGNDLNGSSLLDVAIAGLKYVRLFDDAYGWHEGGEVRQDKPCPMSGVGRAVILDQNRTQSDRDAFGQLRYVHWNRGM